MVFECYASKLHYVWKVHVSISIENVISDSPSNVFKYVPYSLNITPPSFISPPPLTIYIDLLQRHIYLQFTLPSAIHRKFNKNGRTLHLQRTRERLELTIPPYIESSYLLASGTPTKQAIGYTAAGS